MADPATFIASWFTPSSLFIFVNLVIGTIAITSRFGAPKRQIDEPQLLRSPSLLDRVRSFNLRYYNHYEITQNECTQPQLVRTSSLLERVRSFNLSFHKPQPTEAETDCVRPEPKPEPENLCPNPENPKLVRTPSLLQRVQSMRFSRLYRSDSVRGEQEDQDTNTGLDSGKVEMKKSASEKGGSRKCEWEEEEEDEETVERRRPATARNETIEDEEVDARADDFINSFKKHLRLQRMDSILRYRDMLRAN